MLKNLLLVFVALISLYLYLHPRTETRVVTQAAAPMVMHLPVPAPTPVPKLYYHSPLDASAMSTSASTGTGYFSSDTTSRFNGGYYSSAYRSPYAVSGAPVYVPGGSNTQINTVIYNGTTGTRTPALATPANKSYIAGRLPTN